MRGQQNPEAVREMLLERHEWLSDELSLGDEPTDEMLKAYMGDADGNDVYKTDREKLELAIEVGMTVRQLEALFIGRSVLDVGCGIGRLSNELANLRKGTQVTALERDPELLEQARRREWRNLQVIEGSGFDIQEAVGDERFGAVLVCFSSFSWAETPTEKKAALAPAVEATEPGGHTLFVPIITTPTLRDEGKTWTEKQIVRRGGETTEFDETALKVLYTANYFDVLALETLLGYEAEDRARCTFIASGFNRPDKPDQERYSAIVQVQ